MKIKGSRIPSHLVKHLGKFTCYADGKPYKGVFYMEKEDASFYALCPLFSGGYPGTEKGHDLAVKIGGSWWMGNTDAAIFLLRGGLDYIVIGESKFTLSFRRVKKGKHSKHQNII